ncbi:hypothetical protein Emed_003602 [Eimeria media]
MFVPVHPYGRAEGGPSLPPGAAIVPGGFPPLAGGPPGAPVGPLPLVIAPGFPPGGPALPPIIEREPVDVCKLFVGGLNPNTTDAELEDYFKQYGAGAKPRVKHAVVMFDKKLNRSRCFGFVTFNTEKETLRAYCMGPHTIGGNEVELRRAVPRTTIYPGIRGPPGGPLGGPIGGPSPHREAAGSAEGGGGASSSAQGGSSSGGAPGGPSAEDPEEKECKVFIGGIPPTMTTEDIHAFFSKRFGMVRRVDFFYDKVTGRMRGFGFLVFAFPHSAKMAVGHHQLGDVTIEVKKAVDKEEMRNQRETEGASGSSRPPPRRPPFAGGPPGSMMMRPLRPVLPAMEFLPLEMAMHPVAPGGAPGGPPRASLQDPYSVFPHAAAVAAGAPAAATAAVGPGAYGGAYYSVAEQQQQQMGYAAGAPAMYMPPGYGYVVAGGPQDIYAQQLAAADPQQIADPYDVQGAMRARAAKQPQPAAAATAAAATAAAATAAAAAAIAAAAALQQHDSSSYSSSSNSSSISSSSKSGESERECKLSEVHGSRDCLGAAVGSKRGGPQGPPSSSLGAPMSPLGRLRALCPLATSTSIGRYQQQQLLQQEEQEQQQQQQQQLLLLLLSSRRQQCRVVAAAEQQKEVQEGFVAAAAREAEEQQQDTAAAGSSSKQQQQQQAAAAEQQADDLR